MSGILVAGIGNIFKGDDGFGVEVARRLGQRVLPAGVKVTDFGIRGLDLAYALLHEWSAAVLVDTAQLGGAPGSVYVIEHDWEASVDEANLEFSPHELDPAKVLALARYLGATCRNVVVVGCEPLTFGGEDGSMELSAPVQAAVEPAIAAVEDVLRQLTTGSVIVSTVNAVEQRRLI